jgi:hypothetical protein
MLGTWYLALGVDDWNGLDVVQYVPACAVAEGAGVVQRYTTRIKLSQDEKHMIETEWEAQKDALRMSGVYQCCGSFVVVAVAMVALDRFTDRSVDRMWIDWFVVLGA